MSQADINIVQEQEHYECCEEIPRKVDKTTKLKLKCYCGWIGFRWLLSIHRTIQLGVHATKCYLKKESGNKFVVVCYCPRQEASGMR